MSLLMEALKKAEEAKRLAARENIAADASSTPDKALALEPLTPPSGSRLPDLAQHADTVDAGLAEISAEKTRLRKGTFAGSSTNDREAAARAATSNAFAVKQTRTSRTPLWLFIGFGGLAALCLIGYFWWQLHQVSQGTLRPARPPAISQAATPPRPAPPLTATPVRNEKSPVEVNLVPQTSNPPVTAKAFPEDPTFRQTAARSKPLKPDNDPPVHLTRSRQSPDTTLERAYDALESGNTDSARQGYGNVLRRDPNNFDALLGMATIAAMQGQNESANAYYLKALELDPTDATAQAGVLSSQGQANPDIAESRLKSALARQPDSPALLFALGNLYARLDRWSEAQQTYFKAYAAAPENADLIFNLAVSLDHLHKDRLAAQYYRMALDTADSHPAAFDRAQARDRIRELQPRQP